MPTISLDNIEATVDISSEPGAPDILLAFALVEFKVTATARITTGNAIKLIEGLRAALSEAGATIAG
jgi:hypothetical protein